MTITVVFDPPKPSDSPAVFDSKAFTLLGDLNSWSAQANALAVEVSQDQSALDAAVLAASNSAGTATTKAGEASTSATTATTQAGIATTQAGIATAQAGIATTKAGEASTSAANAASSAAAAAAALSTKVSKAGDTMTGPLTLASESIPLAANNLPSLRPSLLLDFANSRSVDPRITFTRASTATRTNSKGLIESVASNAPRIDFDPVTGECKGLLIEEQRTNLLLNSLIDGTNLGTQTVNVTAVAHTLSFYGTGSVTLSGAHSATVTGAGAYPTRQVLTFTPTAGSLVLTVTGDVKFAQLEAGTFPTSFIPTAAAQVTRAADVASMTGANFSSWYRQDEGTLCVDASIVGGAPTYYPAVLGLIGSNKDTDSIHIQWTASAGPIRAGVRVGGAPVADIPASVNKSRGSEFKAALAYKTNDFNAAFDGVQGTTDTSVSLPSIYAMTICEEVGYQPSGNFVVKKIAYYPKRLANAELQALTTP